MNQQAIDSIKAERDAAVRERDAMAQEIERLRELARLALSAIEEQHYSASTPIAMQLYRQATTGIRAALKETK